MFPATARLGAVAALAGLVVACGPGRATGRVAGLDDFGDTVHVGAPAARIVSLSPVTTEILFTLGAGSRVVGRTQFDLYPEAARAVADLGNGMQPNVEAVLGVRPDLVVLYASTSNRAAARRLRDAGIATLAIRTDHIADFRRVTTLLARAIGDSAAGEQLADSVERSINAVRALARPAHSPKVFWFIWESPLYVIGRGSFLHELLEVAGATNIFADLEAPSPQVTREEIVRRNPDYMLTGPENAAKIRTSPAWKAVPAVRAGRILIADTALVGRPGVRLGEAARHLRLLIVGDSVR